MLPYNKKIFGRGFEQLGTYWLDKLPSVSFEETLLSCLTRQAYGKQPAHAFFYYPPKYGYGELWRRMAETVEDHIIYDRAVSEIEYKTKIVKIIDGKKYAADIITTIPWVEFRGLVGMPEKIRDSIAELKFSSIQTEYLGENLDTKAHWIYYPDLNLPYHRILVRHNFCFGSKGYWTETNVERVHMEEPNKNFKHINQYAYPLNTIKKPAIMKELLEWSSSQGVLGLGRWEEHQHYNSDITVGRAIDLAEKLAGRNN